MMSEPGPERLASPPLKLKGPVTVTLPLPERVPPRSERFGRLRESGLSTMALPPEMRTLPLPEKAEPPKKILKIL